MIARTLYSLLSLFFIGGCSTISSIEYSPAKANTLLIQAYNLSKDGSYGLAILKAKQSIEQAQKSARITNELVEGYDDLGLYYFLLLDYQTSAYYQSIAVVLSHFKNAESEMNKVYLERLGWAYAKYNPTFDFTYIIESPLLLACDDQLNIRENIDVRQFLYKRDRALSLRRKNKLGMYTLRKRICNSSLT